jgi:N12 class adenine-specific DNA methylase
MGSVRDRANVNRQMMRKWNMARPLRIAFPGAFYHVTARGNERKAVFKSTRARQKFLEYLIGAQFGIGDAAVARSCKRFKLKLEKDRKLWEKIARFEKMVLLANVET